MNKKRVMISIKSLNWLFYYENCLIFEYTCPNSVMQAAHCLIIEFDHFLESLLTYKHIIHINSKYNFINSLICNT